jgi:hypothetical protein
MNKRIQPQWRTSGIIEAPASKVWKNLLDTFPMLSPKQRSELDQKSSLHSFRQEDNPDVFKTSVGKHNEGRIYLEVEQKQYRIVIQGEWWYRGEYIIKSHTRGTLLLYQVSNIAPGASWWLAQLVQGPQHARSMAEYLQTLLHTLANQLGCATELQPIISRPGNTSRQMQFQSGERSMDRRLTTRILLACGLIGPLFFIMVVLVEGAIRPGYSPWRHAGSLLAYGERGWVQTANSFIIGSCLLCFALGLRRVLPSGKGST